MAFAVGGMLAIIYLLAGMLLGLGAISVGELAPCGDPAAVAASGEDDCIEAGSAQRAAGLALAYASALSAFATAALGVVFARRRGRGRTLAAAAVFTPVLAVGAIFLLPISF